MVLNIVGNLAIIGLIVAVGLWIMRVNGVRDGMKFIVITTAGFLFGLALSSL
jgi:hypothetical protein